MALSRYLPRAVALAAMIATPAFAADWPLLPLSGPATTAPIPDLEYFTPNPVPAWEGKLGARYWFAASTTGKSLYGAPPDSSAMVSRLTYSGLLMNSGEIYGRAAFTGGFFVKGYMGGGAISEGNLKDEDFPPFITPYSSTSSSQHDGGLAYASADVGYDFVRGGDFRVGAFAGYHVLHETVSAYGCLQATGNTDVCQPGIPAQYNVISQTNEWQSVRVGLEAAVKLGGHFTLTGEGAWLPYVHLNGADTHWVRILEGDFSGPIPEDGTGTGYQFEALLSYDITPAASIGLGGRYWHMQTNGSSHFEDVTPDGAPQPVSWKNDVYGVFLQGDIKLGPYPLKNWAD